MNAAKIISAILLAPFSFLYGIGVTMRNGLYDAEVIKPSKFSLPLISVGNLSIGGAGKTPHIEYLIQMLQPYINVATLSRGYNRNTTGFRLVNPTDTALAVGDEPLMYARKFRDIQVAVGENRALAIPQMVKFNPSLQAILLDDAYQHRSVAPYINILLTQYELPFYDDYLLPSGRLREWRSSYDRADIIIVSKCPADLSKEKREQIIRELNPKAHQEVFFTRYEYGELYQFYQPEQRLVIQDNHDVLLISAIANTSYLEKFIASKAKTYLNLAYEDHHNFSEHDVDQIIDTFKKRQTPTKYVVTTEKDAVRLQPHVQKLFDQKIPIYVLPVKVAFLFNEGEKFETLIKNRLLEFEM